ncbi:hypothetical protein JXA80_14145 [bacterium]|nr:hypothetical protein [candidate division CSSED10-310 bacterium]
MAKRNNVVGIRREDKNRWEKRVPVVPKDVETLVRKHGIRVIVQPSNDHRTFDDDAYRRAGAEIQEDLQDCSIILGVKEIPGSAFLPGVTYVFFSHVIKGQRYNMPMLRALLDRKCSLVDYEKIEDDTGKRLIFFGRFAGLAGMVESLHALGLRLVSEGIANPFSAIRQPRDYASLDAIRTAVAHVGEDILRNGLPDCLTPMVCGFTGYGNVSRGAQEILDILPIQSIDPESIRNGTNDLAKTSRCVYKTVFHESHMFETADRSHPFDLQHYFAHPELYRSQFSCFLQSLTMMVNCIFWTEKCPRLVTKNDLQCLFAPGETPRLKIIGDISCDIDGSVEATVRATDLDDPVYVYDPHTGKTSSGVIGNGPVIMAIENLPCEIPVEASQEFSKTLVEFIPALANADMMVSYTDLALPMPIKNAMIAYQGALTPAYEYISDHLAK